MKVRILVILIVLAVLASCITGCTPKNSYLVQVMKLAPENADGVNCTDIKAMAEDPDLSFAYDEMISGLSYMIPFVEATDISVLAAFKIDWDETTILFGNFNLRDVRDTLTHEDYVEGEYKAVEIWTDDYDSSVAFIGNMIVSGDKDAVEACIRVHKAEESSLYDNEEMRIVADKLPTGVASTVLGLDYSYDIEYLAAGICYQNQQPDDDILHISVCYKFDSEASAEAALEDAENEFKDEFDVKNTEVHLSGQFIEITGEVEIPED